MSYYKVPLDCPTCNVPLSVEMVGVSEKWELACNFKCPKCNRSGGVEFDLCELVAHAREEEGSLLQ